MERTAILSKCGKFRYRLGRRWAGGPTVVYVMLNPSTADHQQDDATIRRCISFAQAEGFGALEVVNLFAYRTPHPAALKYAGFPVGADNDRHIVEACQAAERVCLAWGAHEDAQPRVQVVMPLIRLTNLEPYCLAITRSGFPAHPVRLPKTSRMQPFTLEAIQAAMTGESLRVEPQLAPAPAARREGIQPGLWPFPVSAHMENPQ